MESAPCRLEPAAAENTEIECPKRQELLKAGDIILARQLLNAGTPGEDCNSAAVEIEVGWLYEIEHKQLPPKSPIQLKAIRAVLVSEKTKLNVTVRFPSIFSLKKCFSADHGGYKRWNSAEPGQPALDEQFVMGMNVAGKVLRRRIPSPEYSGQKHLEIFWAVSPNVGPAVKVEAPPSPEKKPSQDECRSTLKCAGALSWGLRRKVKYFPRSRETPSPSSLIPNAEVGLISAGEETKTVQKRPRGSQSSGDRKTKEARRDSKDRWSKERYAAAELKLMDIMQAKGAVLGNPILRPELRVEARKHIGDTGLLDHLLKHMAGKVVPERNVRFRRRHNAEGAMEYWLEQADLLELRRLAGVQDPYWAPPPGWKPEDGPLCDAAYAKELKQLKQETAILKRDLEELLIKKKYEREVSAPPAPAAKEALSEKDGGSLEESWKSLFKKMLEEKVNEVYNALKEDIRKLREEVVEGRKGETEKAGHQRSVVKSGFRICKPQGTFLWPSNSTGKNMSSSPQVQAEDLLKVPTPPSTSSTTSVPPPLPSPVSPVKPVPKNRVVTVSVMTESSVSDADHCGAGRMPSVRSGSSGSISMNQLHHDILLPPRVPSDEEEDEVEATGATGMPEAFAVNCSSLATSDPMSDLSAKSWLALSTP